MSRGYCGIGIVNGKVAANTGTLWRSAQALHADFIFTVGNRYLKWQRTDTTKASLHLPLWHFESLEDLVARLPKDAVLIGIETTGKRMLSDFHHPEQAVYLLGAEDRGLPQEALAACRSTVRLPGTYCLNVAAAGTVVLYDRITKNGRKDVSHIDRSRNGGATRGCLAR